MELRFVVPKEETFGELEFASIAEKQRGDEVRGNNGMQLTVRRFKVYSHVQMVDDIEVIVPAKAGVKNFEYMQPVKLVNPKITATGRMIQGRGFTDYVISADDIVSL